MAEETRIVSISDKYIHVKSTNVPDWVTKLAGLKDQIMGKLETPSSRPNVLQPKPNKR